MIDNQEKRGTRIEFVPQIILEENPQEELELFQDGLHNQKYAWQRREIFRAFPDLEWLITANPANEKEILKYYLQKYHQKCQDELSPFIKNTKEELAEQSKEALSQLGQLMDYRWTEESPGYKVVPVLLPYGPFGDNVYFYSVLPAAYGDQQTDALFIAIHEISHMLLFEILKKQHPDMFTYTSNGQMHYPLAIDYLKEILAPVLINQPPLQKLLNPSSRPNNYLGNTELEQIYVTDENSQGKRQISQYFQQLYEKLRNQEHRTFPETLEEMIHLILPLEDEFAKRRQLWNEHGTGIIQDEKLLAEYAQPIPDFC
ncbi:MAG: hypothetical protein M1142_01900 [Patescibacteria group bacterium]|nr:hypothetical protein [Patescibacteria group bacterium]